MVLLLSFGCWRCGAALAAVKWLLSLEMPLVPQEWKELGPVTYAGKRFVPGELRACAQVPPRVAA